MGGGICQITTTLYNAVVYANLEITERTNHQFVPSYAGASRDATVVYGAIDFKFKNNRNYPIKILCSVSSGVANFQILGLKTSEDYDVEIYSRITSKTSNSINSEAYKILKKDGNIISQSLLSKDTYNAMQRIVKRGTKKTTKVPETTTKETTQEKNPEATKPSSTTPETKNNTTVNNSNSNKTENKNNTQNVSSNKTNTQASNKN